MWLKSAGIVLTMVVLGRCAWPQQSGSAKDTSKIVIEKPVNVSEKDLKEFPSVFVSENKLHCSRLQLFSSSHQPIAREAVGLSRQVAYFTKVPNTVVMIREEKLKPILTTDENGVLQLPVLLPATYDLRLWEADRERHVRVIFTVFKESSKLQDCSQRLIEQDGKQLAKFRFLP